MQPELPHSVYIFKVIPDEVFLLGSFMEKIQQRQMMIHILNVTEMLVYMCGVSANQKFEYTDQTRVSEVIWKYILVQVLEV